MTSRALLIVVALAAACGAPARPRCELPRYAHAAAPPFLWTVTRAGAPGTVILFGTIHTASRPDIPAAATRALAAAQQFASELGDAEPDPEAIRALAKLPFGEKSLDQRLAVDDWWALTDAMRGTMHADELARARPWFATVQLMKKVAPAPKPSMDDALTEDARRAKLPIVALETWQVQLAALDRAITLDDLAAAIRTRAAIACSQDRTQAAYVAGDADGLVAMLQVTSSRLILDRNAAWQPAIEAFVTRPGTTFVAVGVGHLLGDGGLPQVLARAGYTVAR